MAEKTKPLDGYDMNENEVRDEEQLKEDMVGEDEAFEIITAELDLLTKDFKTFIESNNKAVFNKYYKVANKTRDSLLGAAYEYCQVNGFPLEIMIPVVDKIASNKTYEFCPSEFMGLFGYRVAAPQARTELYDQDRSDMAPYGYEYDDDYMSGSVQTKDELDTIINGSEGSVVIPGDFAYELIEEDLSDKLNISEYDWFIVELSNEAGDESSKGFIFGVKKNDNKLAAIPMREEQVDEAAQTGLGIELDRDTQDDDDVAEDFRLERDRGMGSHKDKPSNFEKQVSML